jgi:hypothetical protein
MKTLFVLASVMVVLFLAVPANRIEAQAPNRMLRLEARVAEIEKRLAEVEAQLAKIGGTTSGPAQAHPGSNRKLSQDNAEKAINAFASTHSVSPIPATDCSFNVQSIAKILPLSQFSETEATSIVILKCTDGSGLPFKFVFQKDIDNQWFLTKIGEVDGYRGYNNGMVNSMIVPNQNLKVLAQ